MKDFKDMTVGEIVAEDFKYANVFEKYKIDYCCNGGKPLAQACKCANACVDTVVEELSAGCELGSEMTNFGNWPTDLLADYILKFHHRNIRKQGIEISKLLEKVTRAHGNNHPELFEVQELFTGSLVDLSNHLQKEENILFPYVYQLCEAQANGEAAPCFHCDTIGSPIAVMMSEHDAEGERYRQIARLTNDYTTPVDGCNSYRLLIDKLKTFEAALHHHIHLENNIVFPRAIEMELSLKA